MCPEEKSSDKFELQFAVNYLGTMFACFCFSILCHYHCLVTGLDVCACLCVCYISAVQCSPTKPSL